MTKKISNETSRDYQKRMVAAHILAAKIEELKAVIFELATHANNWDNRDKLDKAIWNLYHQADEARDALKYATDVAHYG